MSDAQKTGDASASPHGQPATERPPMTGRLPRRDWILLPLLSLLTLGCVLFAVEWSARRLFRESKTAVLSCLVVNDPKTGVRAIPNTACSEKIFESGMVEYKFNNCGHRTAQPCGAKPPGVFRIVLLGSSFAEGMRVPQEQTFAGRLPAELSRITGRKVEIYNEAMQWGTPSSTDLRIDAILAAQPDLVLWTLTPWDIENVSLILPYVAGKQEVRLDTGSAPVVPEAAPHGLRQRILAAMHKYGSPSGMIHAAWERISGPIEATRSVVLLQHYLYKSPSQYVQHYLMLKDSAGFLRTPTPPAWDVRLQKFDGDFALVADRMHTAGVPMVAVLLPHRAQAVMVSAGAWPSGYDPAHLDRALQPIIEKHGSTYVDVLQDFRSVPHPGSLYLPIDGHMNVLGQAVMTQVLAKELTSGAVPALKPAQPRAAAQQGSE